MTLAKHIHIMQDGFTATSPFARESATTAPAIIGFRPMESITEPNTGDKKISTRAEPAANTDKIDVARSAPSLAMSAGAGEKATRAPARTSMKEDDCSTMRGRREENEEALSTATGVSSCKIVLWPLVMLV
jgi:hypothetical protein